MVTKVTFWIVLLCLFSFKFCRFLSTVHFSNENNYCQLQGIGKLIKGKLSKLINLLMSLEIQISSSLLLTSGNKQRTFLQVECFLEFFSEIMLESFGCGFTALRVFTMHTLYVLKS